MFWHFIKKKKRVRGPHTKHLSQRTSSGAHTHTPLLSFFPFFISVIPMLVSFFILLLLSLSIFFFTSQIFNISNG
ncbi:hypothetical protein RIF29_07217 [Crotalaria pallida]|uniref:Uncharacterized protein n=1 Tax=Crotalaria pallida TaxID=3830 RepID=A0AAN9J5J9_CROPI